MRSLVLVIVVLALTALGAAGAFVRYRPCPSCSGFVVQTPPRPVQPLNCPDCGDSGKVSFFRSWRPRVSQPIADFFQCLANEQAPLAFERLNQLIRNDGKDPEAFLAGSAILLDQRFLEVEGRIYLVMILQTFNKFPDSSGRATLLLTPEGRALDRVVVMANRHNARIDAKFATIGGVEMTASRWPVAVEVDAWQRPGRELLLRGELLRGEQGAPILHLLIRGDRLVVSTPGLDR